ncbi:MAG TPA: hypothetical protein VFN30_02795 [Chitinophagaceae bacterium]|nr:hypothetical protein [Chitinophagaceae bacterium]
MGHFKYYTVTKFWIIALLLFVSMILALSCSKKMVFGVSSVVPAAKGSVKIGTDKNKNYLISVNVMHLADPSRLTPTKNVYVVWMVTENGTTRNLGQLKISTGFLSKTLKGSLKTVTPFEPISFFITAEDDASTQFPGTPRVLITS